MKPEEVRYRALLAVVYWDLTRDLNPLHVFYERTESCVSIASAVAALRLAAGLETEVEPIEGAGRRTTALCWRGPTERAWASWRWGPSAESGGWPCCTPPPTSPRPR